MSTEKIIKDFKTLEELQEFAEAQYKTIIDLSKKSSKLEKQVRSLREENRKLTLNSSNNQVPSSLPDDSSDEEIIARSELKKLKDITTERELTYEECKKVSEYVKILQTVKANKPKELPQDSLKDADLLSIVNLLPNETKIN